MGDSNRLGHPVSTSAYLMPMVSHLSGTYEAVTLEETLVEYLYDNNYISHLIYPFLAKWKSRLDYEKVFAMLPDRLCTVLKGFMFLADIKCNPKNVQRGHPIIYPQYLQASYLERYKKLAPYQKINNRLLEIIDEYNLEIYLTSRDLKVTQADLNHAAHIDLNFYLVQLHTFFGNHDINYCVGGGVSLFLQLSIESSCDIDIVILQELSILESNEMIVFITSFLHFSIVERWDEYFCFQSTEHELTIDIEINQHYRQKISDKDSLVIDHQLDRTIIRLLHYKNILELKKGLGRLKDLNNIFKVFTLIYGDVGNHEADKFIAD
ncbi:hypothetical protein D3C75_229220 [compost metagenome]